MQLATSRLSNLMLTSFQHRNIKSPHWRAIERGHLKPKRVTQLAKPIPNQALRSSWRAAIPSLAVKKKQKTPLPKNWNREIDRLTRNSEFKALFRTDNQMWILTDKANVPGGAIVLADAQPGEVKLVFPDAKIGMCSLTSVLNSSFL